MTNRIITSCYIEVQTVNLGLPSKMEELKETHEQERKLSHAVNKPGDDQGSSQGGRKHHLRTVAVTRSKYQVDH